MKYIFILLALLSMSLSAQVKPDSVVSSNTSEFPGLTKKNVSWSKGKITEINYSGQQGSILKTVVLDKNGVNKKQTETKNGIIIFSEYYEDGKIKNISVDSANLSSNIYYNKYDKYGVAKYPENPLFIQRDSVGIFSKDPLRPFEYGYAYKYKEAIEFWDYYSKKIDLKNGEVIADIGAASGFKDGALSVKGDSITFYIEDIDTATLNEREFKKMVNYFSGLKGKKQTNTFKMILGTINKTNLPEGVFDKVIVDNTWHEITDTDGMIEDMKTKIKKDGKIIIIETFSEKNRLRRAKGCNMKTPTVKKVVDKFNSYGLYLCKMAEPENSSSNFLVFGTDKDLSDLFYKNKKAIDSVIVLADQLKNKKFAASSEKTEILSASLSGRLQFILAYYPEFADYIAETSDEWLKDKKYKEAVNTFLLLTELFPKSAEAYDGLGEAYWMIRDFENSKVSYRKSLELDPENDSAKENIKELEEILEEK